MMSFANNLSPLSPWGRGGKTAASFALATTILLVTLTSGSIHAADWPQFLGPERNARSTETGLLKTFPKAGPAVVWKKDAGDGYASPVIAGKDLILFHRVGDEDVVECLDAETGKGRWKFTYETKYSDALGKGDGPRSTPLIEGKHVYTLAADGRLHCLERATGKKVWLNALHESYRVPDSFFGVGTSPILHDSKLFVNVGGKGSGVVAFDAATGKEVWKALDDEASYASPVLATFANKKQLVFFTRTGLAILDPNEGTVLRQLRWRARIAASVNAASPTIVGNELFISACYDVGGTVLRMSQKELEPLWQNDESLSLHYSTAVHHDGYLYGFHGRQEQGTKFNCVDWKTGKVQWSEDGFGCGSLLYADGQLIVMSEKGGLVLVEATPKAYKETARATVLQGPVRAHMALANGLLYCRDRGQIVCWNLKK